jgi:GNAT superfamily N-acetyltransferase
MARTKLSDVEELVGIQKEAFKIDLEKYSDYDTSPAMESLQQFSNRVIFGHHYTVFVDDEMAGGIDVRRVSSIHCRLFRIFLMPRFQNKGIGSKAISLIEGEFPGVTKWSLDTPMDNLRNRHFYENLGYTATGKTPINDKLILLEYEKQRKP